MGKKKNQTVTALPSVPRETTTPSVGPVIAIVVAIVAFGVGTKLFLFSVPPPPLPKLLFTEHQIQRRNFDSKTSSFSSYLDERGLPVVITGSILSQFPRWNVSDVIATTSSDPLYGLYQHSSPIFGPYYDDQRPMHNLSTVHSSTPYNSNASLPLRDVDRIFHQQHPKTFYSFSSALSDLNPSLEQELDLSEMLRLNPAHSSVNLWLGMIGGTTPCHYDGYHNMYEREPPFLILDSLSPPSLPLLPPPRYLQMSGIKHFLLFPPGETPRLT
jgi:hypothetical protein